MIHRVQLFARARELAGADMLTVDLAEDSTVRGLRQAIRETCPALGSFLERCAIAVDDDYANDETVIAAGMSVAVIPPVSGGEAE